MIFSTASNQASNVRSAGRFQARAAALAGAAMLLAGFAAPARAAQDGAAMDGGYEAESVTATTPVSNPATPPAMDAAPGDPQFLALFTNWKRNDAFTAMGVPIGPVAGAVNVPSLRPVAMTTSFTSGFGVRSDPFRGSAAMHAGIDLAGPLGTPVYATADGVVSRAGWGSGYGNLVEIAHGRGIETRYGHLSRILVPANSRVHRGQLIALMGSTGRSTGSHLHYEVRIDGQAVNPVPYLRSAEYLASFEKRTTGGTQVALARAAD